MDNDVFYKITIMNRRLNTEEFQNSVLMPLNSDDFDSYRREYNHMLEEKAKTGSSIVQDKYLTITTVRPNVEAARTFFRRIGPDLTAKFGRLGSHLEELPMSERMKLLYGFFHPKDAAPYDFDLASELQRGQDPAAYFAPARIAYDDHYLKIVNGDEEDGFYCRSFYLKQYASTINTKFISELVSLNRNLAMSLDFIVIPRDEAIKEAEGRRLNVEANIAQWQRKQVERNNFAAELPYDMLQQREHTAETLNDLTNRDKGMTIACLTMTLTSQTKEALEYDTEELMTTVRSNMCQFGDMTWEQIDGMNIAVPYGSNDKMSRLNRTLTTEELAAFIPFEVQEIRHNGGIYYGQNKISNNLIIVDRHQFQNGNSFILGKSGAGKSFTGKNEVINILLRDPNADVLIIDPEREYKKIAHAFGGTWLEVSTASETHINAMDINAEYGESGGTEGTIALKSEFVMSLVQQISQGEFNSNHRSVLDRCVIRIYRKYINNNYQGWVPTLVDLKNELEKQREPEARDIALALETFATGSLNTFAKKTNVDSENRLIVYDIKELGEQLQAVGMLVVLDSILNRITKNRESGRRTYIFIDEIYLLFMYEYSAQFLQKLWKRVRKYNAMCTGITQNVQDLLQSYTARTMLGNSEFVIMLNQFAEDREILADLLRISEDQQKHVIDAEVGSGLMKLGDTLVPFYNRFPKNALYELMHTDPEDRGD